MTTWRILYMSSSIFLFFSFVYLLTVKMSIAFVKTTIKISSLLEIHAEATEAGQILNLFDTES